MKSPRLAPAILAVLAALSTPNRAALVNGGFEDPHIDPSAILVYPGGSNIGGWTVSGVDVVLIGTNHPEPSHAITIFNSDEGTQALDLTGSGNTGPSDGVSQSIATVPGEAYTILFSVGRSAGTVVYLTESTADLSIDGGPRIPFTNSDFPLNFGTVTWKEFSYSFTATGSSTDIAFLNGTTSNNYVGLDNVRIVPEPSSAVLCLGGMWVALGARRRRC